MALKYHSYLYLCHFQSMIIFVWLICGIQIYLDIFSLKYVTSKYVWIFVHVHFLIFAYNCHTPPHLSGWYNMWKAPNEGEKNGWHITILKHFCLLKKIVWTNFLLEKMLSWEKKVRFCCIKTCFSKKYLVKLFWLFHYYFFFAND